MSEKETRSLANGLPGWIPKSPESNNYKVFVAVGNSVADRVAEIDDVQMAVRVQQADSIAELEKLAVRVGITHRENENIETFRTRIIAAHQLLTSEGTINDLIVNAATLLDVDVEQVKYEESTEPGVVIFTIPSQAVANLNISVSEFINTLENQVAAGYRLETTTRGTLDYISVDEYTNATYDTTKGYDTLDVNGDPTGNGGTYSGLLR